MAVNEQAALHKRQKTFVGKLSRENRDWLTAAATEFNLADNSKALRMVLDYAIQEFSEADLFSGTPSSQPASSEEEEERAFVLDISHVQWLESATKRGFASSSALVDFLILKIKDIDGSLIFLIERSHKRARDTSVRFSIKS